MDDYTNIIVTYPNKSNTTTNLLLQLLTNLPFKI